MSEPKEHDKCEVNEVIKWPFLQQVLFYWIVVVELFFFPRELTLQLHADLSVYPKFWGR